MVNSNQQGIDLPLYSHPNPLFSHHKVPINNQHLNASSINFNNTITPPRQSFDEKGKLVC